MAKAPSAFSNVTAVPFDDAYNVKKLLKEDPSPNKVSLAIGAYRDDEGRPRELPSVREVSDSCSKLPISLLTSDQAIMRLPGDHEYTPELGLPAFVEAAQDLLFGGERLCVRDRLITVQTVAGTHACHIGALLLSKYTKPNNVWISDPS